MIGLDRQEGEGTDLEHRVRDQNQSGLETPEESSGSVLLEDRSDGVGDGGSGRSWVEEGGGGLMGL